MTIENYTELKVGQLANTVLRRMLEDGHASETEIGWMQDSDYSKRTFGINYPLLVRLDSDYNEVRYYKTYLIIYGNRYRLCSQWFETEANNDRPYLERWIESHSEKGGVSQVSTLNQTKEKNKESRISRWAHLKTFILGNNEEYVDDEPVSTSVSVPSVNYADMKIGKLAATVLRDLLENEMVSETEVNWMLNDEYSKAYFGLNYPLLVEENSSYSSVRYYKRPLIIYGKRYRMCSQWFEVDANNDRPYLERWLRNHGVDI